jgi:uncharacterized membrane protein YkoI
LTPLPAAKGATFAACIAAGTAREAQARQRLARNRLPSTAFLLLSNHERSDGMSMSWKAILASAAMALAAGTAHADSAKREVQALSAKVSLTDAIRMAEREGNGRAIDAAYKAASSGVGEYKVEVMSGDGQRVTEYRLDGTNGHIREAGNETFGKWFTRLHPQDIDNASTNLTSAIKMAEQHAEGTATDAEIYRKGDSVRYDVKVVKNDGTTQNVKIDGNGHLASAR